ncbi:hypothetical protein E1264_08335 [Actinomadura sp. KC216]|uniref:hypothetical protein n=1 Tax=Actinomadura sp. KC216 TaxID=2530370 RepID=UPI001053C926|nr:hypothetical protein [Actinomadura sp. KC216]TDB89411.1 hypothetical protein E1264_08335 [Actinomadura sp. KC216]
MPAFMPFVPATGVRRDGPDLTVALPDPPRGAAEPIVRDGVARHAGATVVWLRLAAEGTSPFRLAAPVTGTCRRVEVAGLPDVTMAVELSPLPFEGAGVLRRLPGYPTFYLAPVITDPLPAENHLVRIDSTIGFADAAYAGLLFDDRIALSPAAWVQQIALAMTGIEDAPAVTAWQGLGRFAPAGRSIRVLDHVGRPAAGAAFQVNASITTTGADGTLPLPPGDVQLTWQAARPVHALYENGLAAPGDRNTSTPPGTPLTVPAALTAGHLQLFDAASWFADRPPQLHPGLGHVRQDSRLEPLVDGVPAFRALLTDLRAADGAHFAGWSFDDVPLDLADPDQSMFTEVIRGLGDGGDGDGARFLMDKLLEFRQDAPADDASRLMVLLLTLGVDALVVASLSKELKTDDHSYLALLSVNIILALAANPLIEVLMGVLEDAMDNSKGMAAVLDEMRPGIALRARHPARFADNPLVPLVDNPADIDPARFVDGPTSWHQKFQVVRRVGGEVVGYVGGIDVTRNRLDTPGHHGKAWRPPGESSNSPKVDPFHDVHARITGPAAADLALTFDRRWAFDTGRRPSGTPALDLAFPTPDAAAMPAQPARHLVQITRTGFAPGPDGGGTPLPWSPAGEATIEQATLRAIRQAREYIYIEDQYFTPHDGYVRALVEAAARDPRPRLLIVLTGGADQVVGDIRRRQIFQRLDDAWGDRMIVGTVVRRPVLGDAERVASKGRLILLEPLGESGGDALLTLGPRSRLPGDVPFWLWVEGERMLAVEKRGDVQADFPARRYLVRRSGGSGSTWEARPRAHAQGAPVSLHQVTGIYVHTKAIMVDDVFAGIGSCNTNRRGFFHDGEITAFAVPERLKAARDNPALALRTALWAEHLGIPPAMGRALLADPVAAFELFRRPVVNGNRLSTFGVLGVTPELGFPSESSTWKKMLAFTAVPTFELAIIPYLWNVFAESTTANDPDPEIGPELGQV